MKIQTIIIMISLIIIGGCLLKVALNKKTYEGFTHFINDENKLSFNQLEKKYTNKDCSTTPYDIGSYVEVYKGGETISQAILNPTDYDNNWKSAEVVSYDVNGKYKVKYQDDTTDEVDEDLVKSHHQNVCTISRCGIKDNKCEEDCNEATNIGGGCMPVQMGKDGDNNDIKYQVCPRICRNDEKNIDYLECGSDKCCKGCGFSVFQINDNDDGVSQVIYRLKKIPYDSQSYEIDQTYDYATEMEKEAKRVSDAMDAASFSQTETDEAAINGGTEGEPETEDNEPTASTEDASDDTSSNTVNAFVDHNNCWIGPTGDESFKYCGPAPFSF